MPVPPLVVIGASAGGIEALSRLLALLPAVLPIAGLATAIERMACAGARPQQEVPR